MQGTVSGRGPKRSQPRLISITIAALLLFTALSLPAAQKKLPSTPIDINTATIAQLQQLPGVGPGTAKAIVDFREKSGRFQRVEDLLAIKGISKGRFEKLRPYVTITSPLTSGPPGYHLLKKITLGGDGGWDDLTFDPPSRRLFISRQSKVLVLDVDSGKIVGEIPHTDGVHGIALAPEFNRGFTSNGRAGTISIFDLKTLAVIATAQAGTNPDAIVYDPASKRVFAMNGRSSNATVIDAATGNIVGTIALAGKPEFAVADGSGRVYVNIEDESELWQIDSRKLIVTARWPLAPCEEPTGLAIDTLESRLFAGCDNKMMAVVDAASGKVLATPPIGEGVDGTAFYPGNIGVCAGVCLHFGALAFASNGQSATLTVVRADSPNNFNVVEEVPTQKGARTMTLDPKTGELFLVTADFGPRPAPTPENQHPRPPILPNSFVVLVYGK